MGARARGLLPEGGDHHGDGPPPEEHQPLLDDGLLHERARPGLPPRVTGEEDHAHPQVAVPGDAHLEAGQVRGQEPVRDLGQDARPVTRLPVGRDRAPVGQVGDGLERPQENRVAAAARGGHESNPAGVVVEPRIVQARHPGPSPLLEKKRSRMSKPEEAIPLRGTLPRAFIPTV